MNNGNTITNLGEPVTTTDIDGTIWEETAVLDHYAALDAKAAQAKTAARDFRPDPESFLATHNAAAAVFDPEEVENERRRRLPKGATN